MEDHSSTLDRPLTINEAAEYLQLPRRAVRELCNKKKIRHTPLDFRNFRFSKADLDEFLAKRTMEAAK
jgi:excisionase family DNA binding protein